MGPYRLFGSNGSPYSVKVRSYLRYKEVDHVWLVRNSPEALAEHKKYSKLPLVPTLITPDGVGLQDSTPIIEQLESLFQDPSIYPPTLLGRFMSDLLEEFADEWGNKWMMHLRWYSSKSGPTAEWYSRKIAAEFCSGAPVGPEAMERVDQGAQAFRERMLDRGFTVGSNSSTATIIEQSYLDTLLLLERHLDGRAFLFGRRPALADFGLAGQLYQCFGDLYAGELMRLHAPHVALWCEAMVNPRMVSDGAFEDWSSLASTLEPLIASQVQMFLRWSDGVAKALRAQKTELRLDLGAGQQWYQTVGGPQKYHAKSLQELRRKFAQARCAELEAVLTRCGCLSLLQESSQL